jgi:hypothetical protein
METLWQERQGKITSAKHADFAQDGSFLVYFYIV